MLAGRLPKSILNTIFVLGIVMLSVAGAMEELDAQDHSSAASQPNQCAITIPAERAQEPIIS